MITWYDATVTTGLLVIAWLEVLTLLRWKGSEQLRAVNKQIKRSKRASRTQGVCFHFNQLNNDAVRDATRERDAAVVPSKTTSQRCHMETLFLQWTLNYPTHLQGTRMHPCLRETTPKRLLASFLVEKTGCSCWNTVHQPPRMYRHWILTCEVVLIGDFSCTAQLNNKDSRYAC